MIDNVHGYNGKTPPPSGSQHIMLHTIFRTRALPRSFGKKTFLRNWKNTKAGHHLMNWKHMLPTQLGSMGHCVGPGNVSLLVCTRDKAPNTPNILGILSLKIANS